MYSEQMAYTCHKRFHNIIDLLDKGFKSILILDVDSIVKRDLTELFDNIEQHDISALTRQVEPGDIAYYDREQQNYVTSTQTRTGFHEEGTLGTSNNETTRSFWKEIYEGVEKEMDDWDVDCKVLYRTYAKYEDKLTVYEVPRSYKDKYEHSEDSHIWSGDGIRKKLPKYLEEQKKYL
tara:strand:- start:269 stop:802 length:534 start_codon:yes stop_codon:yes gene_type:complete